MKLNDYYNGIEIDYCMCQNDPNLRQMVQGYWAVSNKIVFFNAEHLDRLSEYIIAAWKIKPKKI